MNRPRKLTAAFVRSVNRPGRYGDGHGLSLLVKPMTNGRWSKTWSQYARIGGNYTSIGLGSYPAVSLAEARAKALANRKEMAAGRDPRNSGVPTLTEATEQVIALHRATWKSGSGAEARWRSAFAHHVLPALGNKQVDKIAVGDVLGVLAGPWVSNPATGRFLAQRLSQVFRWSMGKGYRTDDPTPAATAALPRHNGVGIPPNRGDIVYEETLCHTHDATREPQHRNHTKTQTPHPLTNSRERSGLASRVLERGVSPRRRLPDQSGITAMASISISRPSTARPATRTAVAAGPGSGRYRWRISVMCL